jgi:predicted phage terminase large subunit-like protein
LVAALPADGQAWREYPHAMAARLSHGRYQIAPHLTLISTTIAQTVDAGGGLVVIELPPRHGKSELVSRWVPVWHFAEHPDRHVTLAGYGAALPEGHSRFVRDVIAEHGAGLGVTLAADSTAADRWHTSAGGSCRAVGVGGALTGFGSHLLVIDDPISNAEEADSEVMREKVWEWFMSVALTRREPGATVVVMCTRWHEDDIIGRIMAHPVLSKQARRITLPALAEDDDALGRKHGEALWPQRYNRETLLRDYQASLTARWWNALFQQRPTAAEGAEIKRSWWRYYDELPITWQEFEYRLASWDATFTDASTSDWVVGQVWGVFGGQRYLLDQVRERMTFVETCAAIAKTHERWQCHGTAVELAANGQAIVNSLQVAIPSVYGVKVGNNGKVARVRAVSPQIHAGNVLLPKHAKFSDELVEESAAFPLGKHDDMVDAMSQALSELAHFTGIPVSHLTPTDDRFVPPHVRELQAKGVLGGAFRAPRSWKL